MLAALILAPALMTNVFNVSIENFAFVPDSAAIRVGDTVRWTNKDGSTHTSTATGSVWNSGNLAPNATFQRVFSTAGSFDYHCNIHGSMTAKVQVTSASALHPAAGAKAQPAGTPEALRDVRGRAVNPDKLPGAAAPASPAFSAP